MAAGIGISPAFAQSAKSVVFTDQRTEVENLAALATDKEIPTPLTGSKTTATGPSWFSYVDILANAATRNYYWPIASDSNLLHTPTTGTPFHISRFGIGYVLDPTDSAYFAEHTTAGTVGDATMLPSFRVRMTNPYTVNKVAFPSYYHRVNNQDDTLVIQWTKVARTGTNPFGLYSLTFQGNAGSFASGIYEQSNNQFSDSIPTGVVQTMKVPMDDAYFADTSANGFSNFTTLGFDLPTPFNVGAGEVFIFYATFQSGGNDTLGTPSEAANHMRFYTSDIHGQGSEFLQNGNSLQTGLWATGQQKYAVDTNGFRFQGHLLFIPSNAYSSGSALQPTYSFELECPTCDPISVDEVIGQIAEVRAYPNPAQSTLYVPFKLTQASDVRLTLTNPMGQQVRTANLSQTTTGRFELNVSDLPSGMYFYTLETDAGSRTERVLITR